MGDTQHQGAVDPDGQLLQSCVQIGPEVDRVHRQRVVPGSVGEVGCAAGVDLELFGGESPGERAEGAGAHGDGGLDSGHMGAPPNKGTGAVTSPEAQVEHPISCLQGECTDAVIDVASVDAIERGTEQWPEESVGVGELGAGPRSDRHVGVLDACCAWDRGCRRRGMAQPGSAPASGAGGRRFESCYPDHLCRSPHRHPTTPRSSDRGVSAFSAPPAASEAE